MESFEAIEDLFEKTSGLILYETLLFLEITFQVTTIAVLHGDENTSFGVEVVDKTNYIFIFALSQHSDLSLN